MARQLVECVYLIGCSENSLVKIGRSTDVERRLGAIQRMAPVKLRVLWTTEGDWKLESKLHGIFSARRSHGEWFDFSGCNPVQLVQSAVVDALTEEQVRADVPRANELVRLREPRRKTSRQPRGRYATHTIIPCEDGSSIILGHDIAWVRSPSGSIFAGPVASAARRD